MSEVNNFLIVQPFPGAGAGLFLPALKAEGVSYDIVDPEKQASVDIRRYSGALVMGSPDSVHNNKTVVINALRMTSQVMDAELPLGGICFGGQAAVLLGGGDVVPCDPPELGMIDEITGQDFTVEITAEDDPFLIGAPKQINVFELHEEMVVPAQGMEIIGIGNRCEPQIVKVNDNTRALQFHPELSDEGLLEWEEKAPPLQSIDKPRHTRAFRSNYTRHKAFARQLVRNLVERSRNK